MRNDDLQLGEEAGRRLDSRRRYPGSAGSGARRAISVTSRPILFDCAFETLGLEKVYSRDSTTSLVFGDLRMTRTLMGLSSAPTSPSMITRAFSARTTTQPLLTPLRSALLKVPA